MIKLASKTDKAIAALVVLTALFAAMSVIARLLNNDFTILQQVYLRILAALILSFFVFYKYIRWEKILHLPAKEWGVLIFRGVISYTVAVPLISLAANLTLIGNVAFIAALPFVPLLGFLLFKESVTWWKTTFIFLSLCGVSLLSLHDLSNPLSWGWGDVLAILGNFAFALAYVSRKWHAPNLLNNQEITTLTFVTGVSVSIALSLFIGEGLPRLDASWTIWAIVLLGGIFNVINNFLLNYSFEHLDAVRAGNMINLEIAWGLLFGFLLYSEWPTWQGLLGGCIIVMSVIGMNMYSRRNEARLAAMHAESTN